VDSRDLRQIDVAILSRFRLAGFRSHVDLADSEDEGYPWLFSRDCLEVDVELPEPGKKRLTVFINHFKSKLSTKKTEKARKADMARAAEKRRRQAEEVVKIVRERFPGDAFETGLFAVVGDLNDEPGSPSLAPLVQNAGLENAVNRLNPEKRWTHYWKDENQVSQFDYLLLSPELSRITAGQAPFVQRRGLGFRDVSRRDGLPLPATVRLARGVEEAASPEVDFRFERLKDAGPKLCASDHCPVAMTIPV
jgi:endonuclease/exonuclease/phosphatase family metal-dependent hydrolase